ncbi:ATP-dependent nuclease [Massilia aquatica]|uniref:AAA family ATPase n=1 Tax=Massilia aquatica TaxID=2609000 RepID=A0ABX0MBD9_9BURK|nr:AAA family ATPase [Massilia aquatica]
MPITIQKSSSGGRTAPGHIVSLNSNNWDDYSFKTLFRLSIIDEVGGWTEIGDVKIGFVAQPPNSWTLESLENSQPMLADGFFSIGQDESYYENISALPPLIRDELLVAMRDVVFDPEIMRIAKTSDVFGTSLLRTVSLSTALEQFSRILEGGAALTPFHFGYYKAQTHTSAGVALRFEVLPGSLPSTNIHVLIGRNGIGKTTLLNNMISRLVDMPISGADFGDFYDLQLEDTPINNQYFTSVISASFSAFDPFTPPIDKIGDSDTVKYTYIGLKEVHQGATGRVSRHKDIHELAKDFVSSLNACLSLQKKSERWVKAVESLESDLNFADMDLTRLAHSEPGDSRNALAHQFFARMSSGHAVVLLTLTKLVERTEEKTLILMDEPESHLHPPLLSAFVRALSALLKNRNGVAIIATHSPVILQEVPKVCVWKLRRNRLELNADRPDDETFGENVGTLTRDVFGLEVTSSGYHSILKEAVDSGESMDEIIERFAGQIGYEGRALLRALIKNRGN